MPTKPVKSGGDTPRKKRTTKKRSAAVSLGQDDDIILRSEESPGSIGTGLFQRGNVRHADITIFLRQLIMMLDAGTPILKSLKTLSMRGQSASLRALVSDITQYVEAGNPLWQAFDRHPRYFDSIFVNLIKASEASGTLITVLQRVTTYRGQRELLRKRVRGALVYPVILFFSCFAVMLFLTNVVVPTFETIFERQNLELGAPTKILISASHVVAGWWWLPIVALIGLAILYKSWYIRNPLRRLTADRMKLKIPVFGPIAHKNALVELSRTMALLMRSGLSMMSTLDLTRNAIHNRAVAHSLQGVRDSIEQGGGLEEPLRAASDVIPPVVTDMFVTGEESGSVDAVADQIANVYEEEVKIAVSSIGEAIQPIFTIIVGLAVILLFVALFLPLISMIDSISNAGV